VGPDSPAIWHQVGRASAPQEQALLEHPQPLWHLQLHSAVPGVLFCNRKIEAEQVRLLDIAPTVLRLFGIPAPDYMDGQAFDIGEASAPPTEAPKRELEYETEVA